LITAKVSFENKGVGLIQLAVNTASANQRLADISAWGFKMAFAGVALGMTILIFVDRRLKKNISRLIQITRSMANGDLSQHVEIKTGDEIEHLGESFNMMAEAIKRHEDQLEELVAKRTKELADEKNKLQLILDNVPSAFLMLDKELRVESVSSQFEAVLNKKREEVMGKTCALSELLYDSEAQCPSRKAFSTGKIQSSQARITDSSGEDIFLEHMSIPIRGNNRTEKILEIVTDVTARKRFEGQLIRTEKLSATGEMAAIIAHEMRNSLSSVNLILQVMTDSVERASEEAKSLEVAIESVNRMETIVRQLLEFAKPSETKLQTANINDLVEQSLAFCKYQFQRKQIQLKKNLARDLPYSNFDIEMMREVLINLLLNAADAVGNKDTVFVETGFIKLQKPLKDDYEGTTILLKRGQQALRIVVQDNGTGITSEDLERIFDPFFTRKTQGTGLGLTMARRALAEHGGILQVESKRGKGSTFTIFLPVNSTKAKV
jgi:two-component system sensor histidine kinase AtoS